MTRTNRFIVVAAVAVAILVALGLGYWWGRSRDQASMAGNAGAPSGERKVLYWYDPMAPDQHFDKPGKSPFMDMQLVPKYADEATAGGVAIAPGVRQNLGIRTVEVKRGRLASAIRVPGTIGWDLRQEHIVSARVDAIVERLHVRAPFEPVRAEQPRLQALDEWKIGSPHQRPIAEHPEVLFGILGIRVRRRDHADDIEQRRAVIKQACSRAQNCRAEDDFETPQSAPWDEAGAAMNMRRQGARLGWLITPRRCASPADGHCWRRSPSMAAISAAPSAS